MISSSANAFSIAEEEFMALFSSLSKLKSTSSSSSDADAAIRALHEKVDGPSGVIHSLIPRIWLMPTGVVDQPGKNVEMMIRGDNALSILSYLVESRPAEYMSLTASAIRQDIEHNFTASTSSEGPGEGSRKQVSDALLMALSKLLIGPNSDNQVVGIATNAQAALLALCRWDGDQNNQSGEIAKRVLSTIDTIWCHLQKQQQRESSISQMRLAALMIDLCLLGGGEMTLALSKQNGSGGAPMSCVMDKLLHIALDYSNDDPLLQVSALDQLERLTIHDDAKCPVTLERADFLLSHDILRRGLLCLVGSPGDLSKDAGQNDEWGEADPINGGAAFRLLTEICRVGVSSSASISCETRNKFQLLLTQFQKALHNFHPQGELERLSFIYAVSSLVGSCAIVASSTSSGSDAANKILGDTALLHEWLSLHSRVSQPKLKSTVLCSLSQVMEPSMWQDESIKTNKTAQPSDSIAIQLYLAFSQANNDRDSTELILASAKSPFVEERLGAYSILRALVMRGAGLRLLLLYDDGTGNGRESSFLEWLLNQELESTSEGKKARYQIVDAMLSCNGDIIGGLIPGRALRQLEEWRRIGPNFMSAVPWVMATE